MVDGNAPPGRVLFVDDDRDLRMSSIQTLKLAGLGATAFADADSALEELHMDFAGVLVSDIRMPGMDGLQLAGAVRQIDPEVPVILITGHADVATAVAALKNGVFDFITKPFAADALVAAIRRAMSTRQLVLDNRWLRRTAAAPGDINPMIGASPVMARLRSTVDQIAATDIDVLVEGETGTGKEMVARLIHRRSRRRSEPFVAINCGALTEQEADADLFGYEFGGFSQSKVPRKGRLETAHRGTLFLDEIDSMAPSVQAKLLRVLEDRIVVPVGAASGKVVDIRVIASAKEGLTAAVASGRLRSDLFYRLNAVSLIMPPLRQHPETFQSCSLISAASLRRNLIDPSRGSPPRIKGS